MKSAAVLGAGTMGAQIAAHLANAGLPVLLLDMSPTVAREGLERARALRPDPFFSSDVSSLVTTGGFDEDLDRIASRDWTIEAVVERLDVKREIFQRLDRLRGAGAVVSSNTSGIPIGSLAEGRSLEFRRHFLGTHFFNPPRYLHLLEVIPTPDTDTRIVEAVSRFADKRLGKGVVIAKDTPNFIANHLGLHGVVRILQVLAEHRYTVEEIDAMTGPALGRPKSATFRTMDIAGLDVLALVAANLSDRLERDEDRRLFTLPPLVQEMVTRGWVGEKAGQGFYRKERGTADTAQILTLDPARMEYRARQPVKLPSLEAARSIDDPGARIRTLFLGQDRVGAFLRETLGATLVYAARVAPEIAHSLDDVDRAMRWGFGWDLGPFELWDAIGPAQVLDALGISDAPPRLVRELLAEGRSRFRTEPLPPAAPDLQILGTARRAGRVVRSNPGGSLVDLGDGVLGVELHSKLNLIGADTIHMLDAGVKEAVKNFAALVVGSEAPNFSAGANLMLLLLEAQEENWDEIDDMVRAFQRTTLSLRYAGVPVVVAPGGLALGGGCEIVLHGNRVQAAAETYMGLVELGAGLIPAGGGTKEMLLRAIDDMLPGASDPMPHVQRAFETIGYGRVTTSASDARRHGFLRERDTVTMNRERLIADAKAVALELVREGYQAPVPRSAVPVGGDTVLAPLKLGIHLAWRAGRISDYDAHLARKLAGIFAGGSLPHPTVVSEQYLLDLEREAFLSLCGEAKTHARIQHLLKTGKPLRN